MGNVLTGQEIKEIAARVFANYAGEGALILFAERIERAVLEKIGKQKPVAWRQDDHRGDFVYSSEDKRNSFSVWEPLYLSSGAATNKFTGTWYSREDIDKLVKRLDVAINGESGAAKQAMLCDIVAQMESKASPLPHQAIPEGWREMVTVLANDLESEILAKYTVGMLEYPSQKRSFDADMDPIIRARAMLSASPKQS